MARKRCTNADCVCTPHSTSRCRAAANQAIRDGLHAYDRRHGWRGKLDNILRDNLGTLETYEDDDWRWRDQQGRLRHGPGHAVDDKAATIKVGPYHALLTQPDFAWTGHKSPADMLKVGDLAKFNIKDINGTSRSPARAGSRARRPPWWRSTIPPAKSKPWSAATDFEESKFNRATQAQRQVGSSFKIYVYSAADRTGLHSRSTPLLTRRLRP